MTLLWIIAFVIIILYSGMIMVFITGWFRLEKLKSVEGIPEETISVIAPVRNEEENILRLLNCLAAQDYDKSKYEVIISDDHSSDSTAALVSNFITAHPYVQYLPPDNDCVGKKAAVERAVKVAKGKLILCTDADCTMDSQWVSTFVLFYSQTRATMINGPVFIEGNSVPEQMQSLEFLSLIASGAGAAGSGFPFICNGANMLYHRETFLMMNDPMNKRLASGDDVFLLHNFIRNKHKIAFLKSEKATVKTAPASGIAAFINQRRRWAAKSGKYKNRTSIIISILVFATNLFLLFITAAAFFIHGIWWVPAGFAVVKLSADLCILVPAITFFRQKQLIACIVPVFLCYPFYVLIIALAGFFGEVKWKGRLIR